VRRLGLVMVGIGIFLLALAPLVKFYAAPALTKTPLDLYSTSVSTGTATYFNFELREEVGPTEVISTRTVRGDVEAGDGETGVYDSFSTIEDVGENQGTITASTERFALDRVSAEAVNCCDESPTHSGLVIKFPFSTEPRDYTLWDGTAEDGYPVVYVGTADIDGLEAYEFTQTIGPIVLRQLTVGGDQVGDPEGGNVEADVVYRTDKRMWVEPDTGIIVGGTQSASQTVEYDGQVIINGLVGEFGFSEDQVVENAEFARSQQSLLSLVNVTVPLVALVVGVIALVVGLFLTSRYRA
jgi:hypothetical protein